MHHLINSESSIQLSLFDPNLLPHFSIQPCSICNGDYHVRLAIFKLPGQKSFKNAPVCEHCINYLNIIFR